MHTASREDLRECGTQTPLSVLRENSPERTPFSPARSLPKKNHQDCTKSPRRTTSDSTAEKLQVLDQLSPVNPPRRKSSPSPSRIPRPVQEDARARSPNKRNFSPSPTRLPRPVASTSPVRKEPPRSLSRDRSKRSSRTGKRKLPTPRKESSGSSGSGFGLPPPVTERPPTRGIDRGHLFDEDGYSKRPSLPQAAFLPRKRRKLPKVNPNGKVQSVCERDSGQESGYEDTVRTDLSTPLTDEGFCQTEVEFPRTKTLGFVGTQTESPIQRYINDERARSLNRLDSESQEREALEGAVGGTGSRVSFRQESTDSRNSPASLCTESINSQDEIVQAVLEADRAMQELMADETTINNNTFSFSTEYQAASHPDLVDWFPASPPDGTGSRPEQLDAILNGPITVVESDINSNCPIESSSSLTDSAKQALKDKKKMPATTKTGDLWGLSPVFNESSSTSTPTQEVDGERVNVMYETDSSGDDMIVRPQNVSSPYSLAVMSPDNLWMDDSPENISSQTIRRHTEIIEHEVNTVKTILKPNTDQGSETDTEILEQSLTEPDPPPVFVDSRDLWTQTPRHRTTQTPEDAQTQTIVPKAFKRRLPQIPGTHQRGEPNVAPDSSSVCSFDADTRETNSSLLRTIRPQTEGSFKSNDGKMDETPNSNDSLPLRATRDISQQPEYITEYQKYIESFDGTGSGPFQPSDFIEGENPMLIDVDEALQNTVRPRHDSPTRIPHPIKPRNTVNISEQPVPRDNAGQTVVNGEPIDALRSPSSRLMAMNEPNGSRSNSPGKSPTLTHERMMSSSAASSPLPRTVQTGSQATSFDFDNLIFDMETRPQSRLNNNSRNKPRDSNDCEVSPVKTPREGQSSEEKVNQSSSTSDDAIVQTVTETRDFGVKTPCDQSTQTPLKIRIGSGRNQNGNKEPVQTLSLEDGTIVIDPTELELIGLSHDKSYSPYEILNCRDSDTSLSSSKEFSTQTFGQMAAESHNHVQTQTTKVKDDLQNNNVAQVTPPQTPTAVSKTPRSPLKPGGSRRNPKDTKRKDRKSHRPPDLTDATSENLTARSGASRKNLLKYMLNQVRELKHQINPDATDSEAKGPKDRKSRQRLRESDSEDPEKYAKRRLELLSRNPKPRSRRRHSLESLTGDEPGDVARHFKRDRDRHSRRPSTRDDYYSYGSRPKGYDLPPRRAYTPPPQPRYVPARRRLPDVPVRDAPNSFPPPRPGYYPPRLPPPNMFPPHVRPNEPVFIAGPPPPGMIPAGYWGHPPLLTHPGAPPPPRPGMATAPAHNFGRSIFRPILPGGGPNPPRQFTPTQDGNSPMLIMSAAQSPNQPKQPPYIYITDPTRHESVSDSSGVGNSANRNGNRRDQPDRSRTKKRAARPEPTLESNLEEANQANRDMKDLTSRIIHKR